MFNTGKELLEKCKELNLPISEIVILDELENTDTTRENIIKNIETILKVMMNSIESYKTENSVTMGNIIGGEAKKLNSYIENNKTICGKSINKAMIRALACSQYNASMGRICAAPTAGSSGIIPASLITVKEDQNLSGDLLIKGLINSAGIGKIITQNATVAGAEGGCQAECGSAAAMAASAIVEMMGGTPEMSLTAASISLFISTAKALLGPVVSPLKIHFSPI